MALLLACGGGNEYVEPPPPAVTVSQPIQRDITEYVEFTGRLDAVATVDVRARVRGFLREAPFEEGDRVTAGDLLFQIEPEEFQARVDEASAALEVAKAKLDLSEATLTRLERAGKTRAVSELEVIESRAQRDQARAMVDSRRADLKNARLDLSYTTIKAPITGRVGRRMVDPGNLVGDSERTLLATMVQYDPIYAYFDISERQLLQIAAASETDAATEREEARLSRLRKIPLEIARATDDGFPFHGNVHYADSTLDPNTGTLLMRGIFANPEPIRLFPGLFVRGRMPRQRRENALLVSERALGADQGGRYVLVVDDSNTVEQKPVVTGAAEDGMRVIESGLGPEDWVVVDGVLRARPGAKVNPQRKTGDGPAPAPLATTSGD